MEQKNKYNNNFIVDISEKGFYQQDLNRKPLPKLRLNLTKSQFKVLGAFYFSERPQEIMGIYAKLKGQVHENTIRTAIKLFEGNGLIKRFKGKPLNEKAHSYADKRYKYYVLTAEGEEEYEHQEKIIPR